jgi:hypothetical protein
MPRSARFEQSHPDDDQDPVLKTGWVVFLRCKPTSPNAPLLALTPPYELGPDLRQGDG